MFCHLPKLNLQNHTITSWGNIDGLLFRPGDRLLLGEIEHGDLVVLRCNLSQEIRFGRFYAGTILSEPEGKPLFMSRWESLGAIKAIERSLMGGVLGERRWKVALRGGPVSFQLHLGQVDHDMDPLYLEELARQIQDYSPQAALVVAEKKEWAQQLLALCPSGVFWFVPRRDDSQPCAKEGYAPWIAHSKRLRRRVWDHRITLGNTRKFYAPLPEMMEKEESLAS